MHAVRKFPGRRQLVGILSLVGIGLLAACGKPDSAALPGLAAESSRGPCTMPHLYRPGELSKADEDVFSAAAAGDVGRIGQSVGAGANVDASGFLKRTPLFAAAFCDRPAAAKLLLEQGAVVNAKDVNGMSALHAAVIVGGVDTARTLIAGGADAGIRDSAGRSPLHIAAATNQNALVALLLERGANAAARDKNGMSAAALAAENGHKELAATIRKWQDKQKALQQK